MVVCCSALKLQHLLNRTVTFKQVGGGRALTIELLWKTRSKLVTPCSRTALLSAAVISHSDLAEPLSLHICRRLMFHVTVK